MQVVVKKVSVVMKDVKEEKCTRSRRTHTKTQEYLLPTVVQGVVKKLSWGMYVHEVDKHLHKYKSAYFMLLCK